MAVRECVTAEYIRQLIDYDPETGLLRWKPRTPSMFSPRKHPPEGSAKRFNNTLAGKVTGHKDGGGHVQICLPKGVYPATHIIWLWMTGKWPGKDVDHINGVRDDNRWCNLREATQAENNQNTAPYKNNTSGYTGVWRSGKKWVAAIKVSKQRFHLGTFETPEAGHEAYLAAKKRLHTFQPIPRHLLIRDNVSS